MGHKNIGGVWSQIPQGLHQKVGEGLQREMPLMQEEDPGGV